MPGKRPCADKETCDEDARRVASEGTDGERGRRLEAQVVAVSSSSDPVRSIISVVAMNAGFKLLARHLNTFGVYH